MDNNSSTLEAAKTRMLLALGASLTLGLAPFRPEPHLFGKIKWILGGGKGMQMMDYGDLLLHGAPWILLFVFAIYYLRLRKKIQS